jgi:hypothetical protein
MTVIFPDVEPILVSHLQESLDSIYGSGTCRVGTKKLPAGSPPVEVEVVVLVQYQQTVNEILQEASAVIEVYASEYGVANEASLLVAALVVEVPRDVIKRAVVTLGPVRTQEESIQEKRSISVDMTVKGTNP